MLKQFTAKQHDKLEAEIIQYGTRLLEKFPAEKVAQCIWNKYGYMTGTKEGKVIVKGRNKIVIG